MRVPLSWLREFVDVPVEPERLAEDLTLAGLEAGAVETHGNETVLDLDITTNRVDCMNVYGVAREVSVLYDMPLRPLDVGFDAEGAPAADGIAVAIEAPDLCPRFTARLLDAEVGPSPGWLRDRLEQVGVRPINNVVDLTNYVMMEMGQPSHAFDAALLQESRLIVRWAQPGEQLTTLDGTERTLEGRVGVVADPSGPQGLAGIMGGAASEVSEATRLVVLEAAYWDPLIIRRASRQVGVHTEASHRFERGSDPEAPGDCSARIAHLLQKIGAGRARPGLVDVHPAPLERRAVWFRPARAEALLGAPVGAAHCERVLAGLGFEKRAEEDARTRYHVPSWRGDVSREADLVEEVGRHYGLNRIPSTLPPSRGLVGLRPEQQRDRALRRFLAGAGLSEVIGYSFVAQQSASPGVPLASGEGLVKLANPLSEEQGELRRSLVWPGLIGALQANLRQGRRDVRLFEVGRVFAAAEAGMAAEEPRLGVLLAGEAPPQHWSARPRALDFFDLKGLLEAALARLGVPAPVLDAEAELPEPLHPGRRAAIRWGSQTIGWLGAIHPARAAEWELRDETLVMELSLAALLGAGAAPARATALARYPAVARDLSLMGDVALPAARLLGAVEQAGGALLKQVRVLDRYDRPPVPKGRMSLTLSLRFQDPERTLTGEEVEAAMQRIGEALRGLDVEIRGE